MSDTPQPSPGWYQDPSGAPQHRWWDGSTWTDHLLEDEPAPDAAVAAPAPAAPVHAASAPVPPTPSAQPLAPSGPPAPRVAPVAAAATTATAAATRPAGSGIDAWPIWVAVFLPLLPLFVLPFWNVGDYIRASGSGIVPGGTPFTGAWIALNLVGVLVYAATVALAWLDWRSLRERGLATPFHWAFALLGLLVYIVGRTVLVRRRFHAGAFAPLAAYIGVVFVTFIGATVWIVDLIVSIIQYSRFN